MTARAGNVAGRPVSSRRVRNSNEKAVRPDGNLAGDRLDSRVSCGQARVWGPDPLTSLNAG